PREKRREEEQSAGRVEEVGQRDAGAREAEPEGSPAREGGVVGRRLPRGGQRPGRTEADRVVPAEQDDRRQGAEAEREERPPRRTRGGPDAEREGERRDRVLRDRGGGGEEPGERRRARATARAVGLLGPAQPVPRQEEQGRRPRMAEEGASVEEVGSPER